MAANQAVVDGLPAILAGMSKSQLYDIMSQMKTVVDGLPANLAGMSKSQLYDIMSQMKTLIEQNHQQARVILVQNPQLTKALFEAQILLGMVQPAQSIPNIQPSVSQQLPVSMQSAQQPSNQAAYRVPGQVIGHEQPSASQTQIPTRRQQQSLPGTAASSASVSAADLQSQSMPSQPPQTLKQHMGHLNVQATPASLSQSNPIQNLPLHLPLHSAPQPHLQQQPQFSTVSSQLQQSLQSTSNQPLPLQPPLPPQPRAPTAMQSMSHQFHSQMGPNMGFQPNGVPLLHHSQSMFQSGHRPPSISPFQQLQQTHPIQSPAQPMYQMGGSHIGGDFNNQVGNSMQVDRGSPWIPGQPENTMGFQLPGLPPLLGPTQMGPGGQLSRPPALSADMEKALLQQVMSLTPEQINLLPPDQRHQVLQLQQMLRQ